jgi:hypothetical protein
MAASVIQRGGLVKRNLCAGVAHRRRRSSGASMTDDSAANISTMAT